MAALISQVNAHFGVKDGDRSLIKDVKTVMSKDMIPERRYKTADEHGLTA